MALRFPDFLFSISSARLVVSGNLEALRFNPWTRSRYIMISRIGVWKYRCEHKFSSAWAPALSLLSALLCTVLQSVQCLSIAVGQTGSRKWSEHPVSLGKSQRFHSFPFVYCLIIHHSHTPYSCFPRLCLLRVGGEEVHTHPLCHSCWGLVQHCCSGLNRFPGKGAPLPT